jgi:hypothetical protein
VSVTAERIFLRRLRGVVGDAAQHSGELRVLVTAEVDLDVGMSEILFKSDSVLLMSLVLMGATGYAAVVSTPVATCQRVLLTFGLRNDHGPHPRWREHGP